LVTKLKKKKKSSKIVHKEKQLPCLFSFITLRRESFGGIIFNPYLGLEKDLNNIEYFIAQLCNGQSSSLRIIDAVVEQFELSVDAAKKSVETTLVKLEQMPAIIYNRGKELSRPPALDFSFVSLPFLASPKSVIWDVTYACNLKCPHCLTTSGKKALAELNTVEACELIDALAKAKVLYLSLCGGEPFLRPDILTLLQKISKTNMRVDIATNGVEFPAKIIQAIKKLPVFQVQVSIDGIKEQHDQFRGKRGAFAAACRTLKALNKIGIVSSISTTVTALNLNNLNQIIDLALEFGCWGFKAIPFVPAGRGKANAQKLKLDKEANRKFCEILLKRKQELAGKLNVVSETSFSFLFDPPQVLSPGCGNMVCSAGNDTLSIGADGTVYPCPFLRDFPLGNILKKPLNQIWQTAPTLNLLRNLKKEQIEGKCKTCEYAPGICRGGCRAAAYLATGSLRGSDPNCFS
jgi:radical SAM protein with 4Fe4S-binding SPASM domain